MRDSNHQEVYTDPVEEARRYVQNAKDILNEKGIGSRIWLVFEQERKKPHAVLTFRADQAVVYLELTPQSGKENYGKELVFEEEEAFIRYWEQKNCLIREITELCVPGRRPDFFFSACGL